MFSTSKTKIIIVILIVIVVTGQMGWLGPLENFTVWLLRPVLTTVRGATISTSNFFHNVFTIGQLESENADLRQKLITLETENAQLKISALEVEKFQEALKLKERSGFSLTGARVVSADPGSLNQALLVDRGEAAGLVEGQAVVDSAGALVGRVTRVFKNTAEVTLISDFSSRLPAEVVEAGARGILAGQHGLAIALVEVPQGQNLPVGARVVTTGFTLGVPPGLFVGYLEGLRTSQTDLFQEALLRPAADFRDLRVVFVITGAN